MEERWEKPTKKQRGSTLPKEGAAACVWGLQTQLDEEDAFVWDCLPKSQRRHPQAFFDWGFESPASAVGPAFVDASAGA